MSRSQNNKRRSKRPDKKQQRKKEAALVERCIQALNTTSGTFRTKLTSKPATSGDTSPPKALQPTGELKLFKPIRIETVVREDLATATAMLDQQFSLAKNSKDDTVGGVVK